MAHPRLGFHWDLMPFLAPIMTGCTRTDYRDDILNWDYCTIYVLIVKH
jgi:hypothetical protein